MKVIDAGNGNIIKGWHDGVQVEEKALDQLKKAAQLPFVYRWIASMADIHWGNGSAIGTVLPTLGAIVPSAVGVDLGCGMIAVPLHLKRSDFGDNLGYLRERIEKSVPAGRSDNGGPRDIGAWGNVPEHIQKIWDTEFSADYAGIVAKNPGAAARNTVTQLGTLGTGNHFIELSVDPVDNVWIVLHSGSRGLGNKIGQYFTNVAKEMCAKWYVTLPDPELAYLPQDTEEFFDYLNAVHLAQRFALRNREIMLEAVMLTVSSVVGKIIPYVASEVINCHHNYVAWERHFGKNVMVTRKGAVRAQKDDWGIIPGSMGAKSFIVRGKGNPESFNSCSHGAGRVMSRGEAKRRISLEDHMKAVAGVECRVDADVIDESPAAYKSIDAVMSAQEDLVEIVHTLKQVVCVKG